ncbi:protein beta [Vibrio vulnificus]|uniref:beta family protein n=1 Tax=Vibrio vulnificus TaxID=672 RepID=UPI001D4E2A6F|nr:beta family protein [Vibrio vulnificus]EGR1868732.1 protein beta [Vibrio vulnificus]ELS3450407.1 beta family protein [Vibrio vulnificus]ELS9098932.1 beta family protein [Vibrio vulnificus]MCR9501152.1 beta family protein [Vibrio vulnificus]MCU8175188.1 beta family protein [Vibrio vulnificus]
MFVSGFQYKYAPILSLSPAEMNAIEELPEKDKDIILPLIPLKGWVGSQSLNNSVPRIEKAIGKRRHWIADIDGDFLEGKKDRNGEYPREVFGQIERLLDSNDGYANWCDFLEKHEKAIPVVQLKDINQLASQLKRLSSLGRGVVVRVNTIHIQNEIHIKIAKALKLLQLTDVFFIFDYEQVDNAHVQFFDKMGREAANVNAITPNVKVAISCSSFPLGFAGYDNGENPIVERLIFNKIRRNFPTLNLIYSDRGSARAEKINGGGGVPAPRIDYPLLNDWRFIRHNLDGDELITKDDRVRAYAALAKKIMKAEYWESDLKLWGTQVIELTAKREKLGINNPARSTAVRINIHLYKQLHYDTPLTEIDTDEEWVD